jgi:3-oxoacyl-[acyl-carrier-protein] synthase-3
MGTTIDGIGLATAGWRYRKSALHLANAATSRAMADAGLAPRDVDLLINCGIYRDHVLGEPALAALIQEDTAINVEDPHAGAHGTFSFDVANGTCGVLNALQIVDRFARAGTVRHGLVVASDADPGGHLTRGFPYTAAGGAIACGWTDEDRGLGEMRWGTWPDDGGSFRSTLAQQGDRNRLTIDVDESFAERAGTAAAKLAAAVLDEATLRAEHIGTVVLAPSSKAFVQAFVEHAGLSDGLVVAAPDVRLHTAAFVVALEAARAAGRLRSGDTALFVCASGGITAGACLYRP